MAQQVPAAKDLFEKPEEDFNRPALGEDQTDDIRWDIQQVGRDSQNAVAVDATGTTADC